jgi:uncharacterized membrane protein
LCRDLCDVGNTLYSLTQTKSSDSTHSQLNDKQNGYTRKRFYQNNNANQSNYNNNQQQPIPTRITTRKRVKDVGRKSNLKRNECKNICTDYCKSNISKPYEQSKIRNGHNGRNNEDFRTESWGRDKIGWFQFYY